MTQNNVFQNHHTGGIRISSLYRYILYNIYNQAYCKSYHFWQQNRRVPVQWTLDNILNVVIFISRLVLGTLGTVVLHFSCILLKMFLKIASTVLVIWFTSFNYCPLSSLVFSFMVVVQDTSSMAQCLYWLANRVAGIHKMVSVQNMFQFSANCEITIYGILVTL